jgi:ribosome-associated protein
MNADELVTVISAAAAEKKARDLVQLDLRGKTTVADYFVVCEGDTDRQVRAIVDSIEEACRLRGVRPLHVAGLRDASWACVDFDSVVAHIFLPGERVFYDLEGLWGSRRRSAGGAQR